MLTHLYTFSKFHAAPGVGGEGQPVSGNGTNGVNGTNGGVNGELSVENESQPQESHKQLFETEMKYCTLEYIEDPGMWGG